MKQEGIAIPLLLSVVVNIKTLHVSRSLERYYVKSVGYVASKETMDATNYPAVIQKELQWAV